MLQLPVLFRSGLTEITYTLLLLVIDAACHCIFWLQFVLSFQDPLAIWAEQSCTQMSHIMVEHSALPEFLRLVIIVDSKP